MAPFSEDHKAAMKASHDQNRGVRAYLEALEATRTPRRSSRRDPEKLQNRRAEIAEEVKTAGPVKKLELVQERMDIDRELTDEPVEDINIEELENGFVQVAAGYSQRKGISYAAWREIGVAADVLKRSGISRSSS